MESQSEFAPQWTKIIARAWVDPKFKSQLEANPDSVLTSYGITKVGGRDLKDVEGHISVVDSSSESPVKPHMEGDQLVVTLPKPPQTYDTVVDPASVGISGAGSPGNAHTNWVTENGGVATVWTSGTPGVTGVETGQGPNDSKTPGGAPKSQSTNNQSQSVPSVPSIDDDDDDDDGEAGGAEAGEDAGAEAGEAAGEAVAEGGADAAADAAAAAAALCA